MSKKAHKNGDTMEDICNISAMNGNLDCLKYAHENGDIIDQSTCAYACESNSLEILKEFT